MCVDPGGFTGVAQKMHENHAPGIIIALESISGMRDLQRTLPSFQRKS